MNLTDRQEKYLRLIINDFITNGDPIGSHTLISKYNLNVSSATVRNEMFFLEKEELIEKVNTSSGRIPTTKGYKYYVKYLMQLEEDKVLKQELAKIFAKRTINITSTMNEAINKISEITGLTIISSKNELNELLKGIQLIPIDVNRATIIIITSSGRVESQTLNINPSIKMSDIRIAIQLLQERLINTPLSKLNSKMDLISKILMDKVVNFELIIQEVIMKIFDFSRLNKSKIYGEKNIIEKRSISREQLIKLISLLDKQSIWNSIEDQSVDDENLKIHISDDNTSIVSKKLDVNNTSTEISIIGSNRLKYTQAVAALKILEKFLRKNIEKK